MWPTNSPPAGEITCKKLFGEYSIYCDRKLIGLICTNQLFIKITATSESLLTDCPKAPPYTGSKPYFYIHFIETPDSLITVIKAMWDELSFPKPRKPKSK